jgi:outer membrane lipoprotein carrier protein
MMNMSKRIAIAIFISVLLNIIYALAGDETETIVKKLQKKYDSIRDASVTYVQHVQFGVTKSEQNFSGSLVMKKENKYRIEMEQQTIVTDGKSVWSFNKSNNQLLIDKYKDDPKSFSPEKVLVNLPGNYNAAVIGKEKIGDEEYSILKLTPKQDKFNFKWMKVWVDPKDWLMKKIQVLDISDNLMTYTLHEIKINQGVLDTIFQFVTPDSAEVIDLR